MKRLLLSVAPLILAACGGSTVFPAAKSLSEGPPLRPFEQPGPAEPPAPVAKDAPRPLPWKSAKLPSPTERRLSNGIRVVLAPRRDFPTATVLFVLDRGASAAPPGVAPLYARALWGDSDAYELGEAAEYVHFVGATMNEVATDDAIIMQVSALSPLLPSALSRAAPMFVTPHFDGKSLDRARAAFSLNEEADLPARTAKKTLRAGLYPAPHPYGRPASLVSSSDVASVKKDALTSFRDMYLTTERVHVIAAGDFDPDALVKTLERLLANVPKKAASTPPPVPDTKPACNGVVTIVDRPGSVQSSIAIGWPSVAAADGDRAALEVLSAATGGWLSSRVNLTVRKELGASYGVHTSLIAWRDGGTLELTSAVETPRTAEALAGILRETERLRTEPLGADELETAKTKALTSGEKSSSRSLAYLLAHATGEGLPASYVMEHAARVDALAADEVRAVAEKWLTPARRCIVVVGDASKIAPAITNLGIGRVDVSRGEKR
jgi:zinc protease